MFLICINIKIEFDNAFSDAEGDLITFSSDDELIDALSNMNDEIFRIYIRGKLHHYYKIDIF